MQNCGLRCFVHADTFWTCISFIWTFSSFIWTSSAFSSFIWTSNSTSISFSWRLDRAWFTAGSGQQVFDGLGDIGRKNRHFLELEGEAPTVRTTG
jgi:hypothetical protein